MRIAVLTPSEIAKRRFMPAIMKCDKFEYAGVGARTLDKAEAFVSEWGGKLYNNYTEVIEDETIDAVYIPLPPQLHYEWTKKAILAGKHVLCEKPFSTSYEQTEELIALAKEKKVALHENYMFVYHSAVIELKRMIDEGLLGKVRNYRVDFGFPRRGVNDFRYDPENGGGAFLDAGGYCIKYGLYLLGNEATVTDSFMNPEDCSKDETAGKAYGGKKLDLYGCGTMRNVEGTSVQYAYGMDNDYRCDIDVWGSTGQARVRRIMTAPDGLEMTLSVFRNGSEEKIVLSADDAFYNSIMRFGDSIENMDAREEAYAAILSQAKNMSLVINRK